MEDDIQKYLLNVMFRGTPCMYMSGQAKKKFNYFSYLLNLVSVSELNYIFDISNCNYFFL